jgi:hypothetical protein
MEAKCTYLPLILASLAVTALPSGFTSTRAEAGEVYDVCHGQFEHGGKHDCGEQSYNYFASCAGGGRSPDALAAHLCGTTPGGAANGYVTPSSSISVVEGDRCGYSWFKIVCN